MKLQPRIAFPLALALAALAALAAVSAQAAPAAPQSAADPHWPGERLPYQNLTTGEPRTYDPGTYAPPAHHAGQYGVPQGYADPRAMARRP